MSTNDKIKVTFSGMESSDAIQEYTMEKILKHRNIKLLEKMIKGEVIITENTPHRGVKNDFLVEMNFDMPKKRINVKVKGEDVYAMIDDASDNLFRRLKRYHGRLARLMQKIPWRKIEATVANNAMDGEISDDNSPDLSNYANYKPESVERIMLEELSPMPEAEAIEQMELSNKDQLLFRNAERGNKFCMVFRNKNNGYTVVEPKGDELMSA